MENMLFNKTQTKNSFITIFSLYSLLIITLYIMIVYSFSISKITTYCDSITIYLKNNDFSFLDNNKKLLSVAYVEKNKNINYIYKGKNENNISSYIDKTTNIVNFSFNRLYYYKKINTSSDANFIYLEANILSLDDFYYFTAFLLLFILLLYCFFCCLSARINSSIKKVSASLKTDIIIILKDKGKPDELQKDNIYATLDILNIIYEHNIKQYNEINFLKTKNNALSVYKKNFLQLNKSKDMFLATISHELRTPINGIISMLDIMSHDQKNKSQTHHISIAKKSADSLLQMINSILEYAKLEYSNEPIKNSPIDLNKILDNICLLMIDNAIKNKTDVIVNVDPDIQDNLIGDEQKVTRILTNLVSNAVKNTINGDVIITLDVTAIKNNTVKIKFTVQDSGVGIKAKNIEFLDKPFIQIDSIHNSIHKGSGLGLYITKKLIDILGGNLRIDTKFNQGSKFYFDIDFCFIDKQDNFYFNFYNKLKNKNILVYTQKDYCVSLINSCFIGVETTINYAKSTQEFQMYINKNTVFDFIIIDLKINDSKELFIKLSEISMHKNNNCYIVYMGYFNNNSNINFLQKPLSKIRLLEVLTLGKSIKQEILLESKNKDCFMQSDKTKCLIVEDDVISQNVLSCMLEEFSITNNTIVNNAEDAIKLCNITKFDIVFMDHELPGLKGFEAIKQIREYENNNNMKKTIIIFCSAHINNKNKQKFLSCGVNYNLAKPIILENLRSLLHSISSSNTKILNFDEVSLLNNNRFIEIQKLMGNNFINFIELYYKNCLKMINEIKKALETNNQDLLMLSSHKLKSSSSNIGALRISNICTELEQVSLENNNKTAKNLLEILEKSATATSTEFNKYI